MTQLDAGSVARRYLSDLRIRPYNITDDERLRRMSGLLSPASLYTRFFVGSPAIPENYVRALHALDHWNHEALVALADDDIVGVAEYVRNRKEPSRAELAVLVADRWQRHGLSKLLVPYLAEVAARRGITEFNAEVIPGNSGAMSAVRVGWPAVRPRHQDGAAHFRLPLHERDTAQITMSE